MLDIAAGSGNVAIPAARAGASVVASDLTPELLEVGRQQANVDRFQDGTAFREYFKSHYGPTERRHETPQLPL